MLVIDWNVSEIAELAIIEIELDIKFKCLSIYLIIR